MSENCVLAVARAGSSDLHRRRLHFMKSGAIAISLLLFCASHASAALSFSGDVMLNTAQPQAPASIGATSIGSLQLDNGSTFSSGTTTFGGTTTGFGTGIVTGPRTYWRMGAADVGMSGIGRLEIQNGGIVETTGPMRVGVNNGAHGTVTVEGDGSTLQVRGPLTLGSVGGLGQMEINDGAVVNTTAVPTLVARNGRLILNGGLLRTSSLTNEGLISGSGELNVTPSGTFNLNGRLEAGQGDYLRVSGTSSNKQSVGVIAIDGGEIEFLHPLTNGRQGTQLGGEVTLRNGTMRVSSTSFNDGFQFTNFGSLLAIGGENHFYGRIVNPLAGQTTTNRIAITNESVMIFHDDVVLQGGTMTVFPGSKATLLEDLTLNPGAVLMADIAGSDVETDYGQIEVVGNVQLGGGVRPILAAGYAPQVGDSFQILKAFGGIEGTLTLDGAPALPDRLMWDLEVNSNQVLLNVVSAPDGDYNRDGLVDSADYVVWRKLLDQAGPGLVADGDDNNIVNDADYQIWRTNFGSTIAAPAAGAAAVPEPAAALLVYFAAAGISLNRKRKLHYCSWPL
jgi:T5SS/PEP-CTERM-associated repeat protein